MPVGTREPVDRSEGEPAGRSARERKLCRSEREFCRSERDRKDGQMMTEETFQQKLWKGAGTLLRSLRPLLLYLCLPSALVCVGMVLYRDRDAQDMLLRSGHFYNALGIVLTLVLLHKRSKKRGSSIWQDAALFGQDLAWKRLGLLFGLGFGLAVLFSASLTLLPFPESWVLAYRSSSGGVFTGTDQLLAIASAVFLAPVAEEIVFRGYMLGRLLEGFDSRPAVLLTAAVFALCHVSILWMLYAGLLGILLGWVAIKEDDTVYAVALHMGFNMSLIPIGWINGDAARKALLFGSPVRIALWGAGAGLLAFWTYRCYKREEIA